VANTNQCPLRKSHQHDEVNAPADPQKFAQCQQFKTNIRSEKVMNMLK
jgi:hypothetical protein